MDSEGVIEDVEVGVMDLEGVIEDVGVRVGLLEGLLEDVGDDVWLLEGVIEAVDVIVEDSELDGATDCVMEGDGEIV